MKFDLVHSLALLVSLNACSAVALDRRLIQPSMSVPQDMGSGGMFKPGERVGGGFFFNPFAALNPGGGGLFGDVFNFYKFTKGNPNGVDVQKVNGSG